MIIHLQFSTKPLLCIYTYIYGQEMFFAVWYKYQHNK